ncbi:amino acid adenylation domain-containing protein [Streptomyces alkaliphilus]|uniref:Amino acid adenylation domain-containing protein n=1 Tax=Streptomyces alkaliphilus TaxID=1472722 RepID=A0A7W3T9T4_9ACTN|nr:non-ribosomal peptide synthetase/type I polyketide synthase [Streptomyces alkaliphilus]MBB0242894.1 amino acid adenylation domain-containing protein [Streptomyces alkaliphilus]
MEHVRGRALCRGPEPERTEDEPRDAVEALLSAAHGGTGGRVVTLGADGATTSQSYAELLDGAQRLLTTLRARGVRRGDAVVLCGLPPAEFFPAFWACVLGGARPAAIAEHPAPGSPALERLLHTNRLLERPLVVSDESGAAALARTAPELRVAIAQDCMNAPPSRDHVEPEASETALLMLSSGSTGAPKAARLTHGGLADFAASSRRILEVCPEDTMVNWLPVDHSGAFLLYHLLGVFTGCSNVHAPTDWVLSDPLRWLDLLHVHRAQHSWAPNFAYGLVAEVAAEAGSGPGAGTSGEAGADTGARRPGGHWDFSALKTLLSGGERVTLPVMRRFLAATAAYGVEERHLVPAWGMAETTTAVTFGRLDRPGTVRRLLKSSLGGEPVREDERAADDDCVTFIGSGAPAHGVTLRVVDEDGDIVPTGCVGRLQVHSAGRLTPGYVNNPEADAAAFPDGRDWLETGDLAFLDGGQLFIAGRRKDVIILNGNNVYCQEVEEAATAVSGVRQGEVAACGVPHPEGGTEELAVFFVSRGAAEDVRIADEVRAALFTRLRLAAARVRAVPEDEFPRTPAGKIRRAELRDRLLAGAFDAPTDPATAHPPAEAPPGAGGERDAVASAVREELGAVLGRPVVPDLPFYELGVTSVLLARLRTRLEERLGIRIAQTEFFEHPTAKTLAAHLSDAATTSAGATPSADLAAPVTRTGPAADATGDASGTPENAAERRVAIVGLSLRFPGADSPERFWSNLRDGVDSIRRFDEAELAAAGPSPARRHDTDPGLIRVAGVLDGAEEFDPEFFGMSPGEAELTHPAHRLFLECCHRALEDGGYAATEPGTTIGVFAGSGMNLYDHQSAAMGTTSADATDPATGMRLAVGWQPDFLATRVAYRLGLTGPAIGVQTACSTSLVAVHLAAQSLLSGETDLALAGAAAVHLPQDSGYRSHPGSVLSPTGRCRAFDAAADGTVGGNGVAAVLLKRLDRALADGDTVHAVLLGSAVNNDGAGKVGFTAPGVAGQVEVVRQALRRADIPAETLSYVEAHGTGTRLGDPVELTALARVLGEGNRGTAFCTVGSVKPNIGHLDSCAGMAGLIKTVLMLRHRTLVPTPHLSHPNPELPLEDGPLTLATELRPWPSPDGTPRRAGVSSLGVGGTNAHVVLQEAPPGGREDAPEPPVLVPVSARDARDLSELTRRLRDRLRQRPEVRAVDVAATLALGRPHRAARTAVVGRTAEELARALAESGSAPATSVPTPSPLAFACSGQGSAHRGMASGLYAAYPAARRLLDRCAELYAGEFGGELLPLLLESAEEETAEEETAVWPTETAQVALFAQQAALVEVWRTAGVRPALLLGHSVGEYAALYAAGALTLEDAVRLTAWRGRLMQKDGPPGGMLAVRADPETAQRVARASGVEVAAVNGPRSRVLSGAPGALTEAARMLDREGLRWRTLPVDRAFHSAALEPAIRAFRAHAERVTYHPLHTPVVTTADGRLRPAGWTVDADYLCRQARWPVRFDLAMTSAARFGCEDHVEIGPGTTLSGLGRQCEPAGRWLSGQGTGDGTATAQVHGLLTALGSLYRRGVDLDWHALTPPEGGRVPLPGHPLRRRPMPSLATPVPEPSAGAGERPSELPDQPAGLSEAEPLAAVAELTAAKLGMAAADVTPDSSFFALGADSLSLMGMTTDLEQRYGVRVPVRELFESVDTPRKLAERLARLRPAAADTSAAPETATPAGPRPTAPADPGEGTTATASAAPTVRGTPETPSEVTASVTTSELHQLFDRQLKVVEKLVEQVSGVISGQLDVLRGAPTAVSATPAPTATPGPAAVPVTSAQLPPAATPAEAPAAVAPVPAPDSGSASVTGCDFSLYFFGDYPRDADRDKYGLIMEASEYADEHGFHALWFPERHFNSFGALFPNPSVLAAALAARTRRVRLHAGSVVLPLHHPVRVAEEWSVVDNISGGRAGLCFASGWHATDFSLAPQHFGRHREVMYEHLEEVRTLWSGQPLRTTAGDGRPVDVTLHPSPVQRRPPMYVAVVGNPDSYRRAAAEDLGVVTNLMTQTVEQLAENIALYRRTRAENGLDPAAGRVVVLVHTYLGEDAERARAEAYQPFVSYLRSSLALFNQVTNSLGFELDLENTPREDVDFLLGRAYDRYCASRALIGDERTATETVHRLVAAGADELACFVDFGVPKDKVLAALPLLDRVRNRTHRQPTPAGPPATVPAAAPAPTPAAAARVPRRLPLTPAQRRIWFLERLHPGTSMYHEPKAIRLDGPLDVSALRRALRYVAERHPALRTVFGEQDGTPYQEIRPRMRLDCPIEDHPGATVEEALRAVLATEGRRILDLTDGPPVTARLLRLSEERHLLFLLAHHIVFDSSSTAVLVRDLAAAYRARTGASGDPGLPPLPELPPAGRPGKEELAASLDFWHNELNGAIDVTLPTDRPRPPVRSGEGASLTHALDAELVGRLRAFAATQRATLFMTMTGAIGAVLGRFSDRREVVLGTAVAARPVGAEDRVGLFLDTVPLRVDLTGEPNFPTLLRRVRDGSMSAYEHRDVPFDELVAALNPRRAPGRNPLFQVMVEYENEGMVDFDPPRLTATLLDVPSPRAPFDLSVYLTHHTHGLRFMVEYDTVLFDEATVRRFVDHVEQLLRRVLDTPDTSLAELTAVTAGDRAALIEPGRHRDQPPSATGDTLHGLVEQQVRRTPDAIALISGDQRVSYAELDSRSDRLAAGLRARGAVRGARVAVLLPRGPELITALLGVLKSGAAYLPLDPSVPTARLTALLADGAPVLLLTSEAALARHPGLPADVADVPVHRMGHDGDGPLPATPPADGARPEDPAYCLYTSGSTGRPKGVLVPHRGPVNLVRGHLGRHPALRTLQWTSPSFDVSVQEIFTTLAAGAALVLIDDGVRHDPAALGEEVRRHGVQRMFMPCTPLKYLVGTGPDLPTLRELHTAGEPLQLTEPFRDFLAAHPECVLYNEYGPTEASIIVTSHRVERDGEEWPPIGTPVPGAHILLLDSAGRRVPVGAVGEIHVGGAPVALGYHARPEETAAAFLDDGAGGVRYRTGDLGRWRNDGTLQFCGRVDDQVKIRGHRVEPAEIQAALTALPGVRDAAVLPRRDPHGELELVAYPVVHGAGADLREYRTALAAVLPDHMVPRHWVRLARLPVNAAGKLDRAALPAPGTDAESAESDAGPDSSMEKALHDLWCEELGLREAAVTRSFFELGGHSLSAIRLLHRMAVELELTVSLADFVGAPTIRALAERFAAEEQSRDTPGRTADAFGTARGTEPGGFTASGGVRDVVPMPSVLRRLWRRHHERPDPSVYHVVHRIDLRGELVPEDLGHALTELVARHDALRSRALHRDGEYLLEVLTDVPVELPVSELSEHAEDDVRLERWCRELASRPFALDRAPLFRFGLARLGPDHWMLVTVLHHAICDGWSIGVLWRELSELYRVRRGAGRPLPPPVVQFTDCARAEHGLGAARRAELERFWRAELGGVPLTLDLPYDHPRPAVLSGRGAQHTWQLDTVLSRRLTDAAGRLGTTPYAFLAAGFAVWAARRQGRPTDVVLAASSANRLQPDRADVVGLLGDSVLLRARLGEAETFADLARQLGTTLFAALDHQELPLTDVADLVAPGTSAGLFPRVLFTVVTTPPPTLELDGVSATVRGLPMAGVARNELYVVLVPHADGMTATFEYSTDLFTHSTIEAWTTEFTALLTEAAENPLHPLSKLLREPPRPGPAPGPGLSRSRPPGE